MFPTEKIIRGKWSITLLRCAIGWHFFLEGISKFVSVQWTAKGYLENAIGPFADIYHKMATSEISLIIIDNLNIYGLILIGLALFLGIAIRFACISAIILLILYYLAYPAFGDYYYPNTEGNLYLVNRNIIEALALLLLICIREKGYGLYGLLEIFKKKDYESMEGKTGITRREALKHSVTIPMMSLLGYGAFKKYQRSGVDVLSGATRKLNVATVDKLMGQLPKGKLGKFEISRLVLGGNMIGGWVHSRDLRYVSELSLAYNTEQKIFETLLLAEQAGINTINIGFPSNPILHKYKKITGSKIIVISQVAPDMEKNDYFCQIKEAIDYGADIIQIQGNWVDKLTRDNKFEIIEKMMEEIKRQGYMVGMGSHALKGLLLCEEKGLTPDYYMKTMHHDRYWSAHPKEYREEFEVIGGNSEEHNKYHDNMFCAFPERDVEFVNRSKIPVMAFKVLAGGAIDPRDGFEWALQNGADFLCVGMFDFQIVRNVNTMIDITNNLKGRKREWFA